MNVNIARLISALAALGALSLGILAIAPEAHAGPPIHGGEVTRVLDGTCETVAGRHIDQVADSKILKFGRTRA